MNGSKYAYPRKTAFEKNRSERENGLSPKGETEGAPVVRGDTLERTRTKDSSTSTKRYTLTLREGILSERYLPKGQTNEPKFAT